MKFTIGRRTPARRLAVGFLALAVALVVPAPQANARLAAVGPIVPAHGFPLNYTDTTGLTLDLCLDANGLCLEVPPDPTRPPRVPGNFPDEAFWWAAEASMPTSRGGEALLVLAMEAAFLNEVPAAGEQITFGRIRVRVDNLIRGETYRVIHPFGTLTFVAENSADRGINFTEDIGCLTTPCDFAAALQSNIGPFLRWDPAVAPAPPAGYIGDPNVPHRVVGSPTGNNFFEIRGPSVGGPGVNRIRTDLFAVQGKLEAPRPKVAVSPASVSFGDQGVGTTSAAQTVVVENTGGANLTVNNVSKAGVNAADFAIVDDDCEGTSLAPGSTCSVDVTFRPSATGARTAQLRIGTNALESPTFVSLTGTGTTLVLSPSPLRFARRDVGTTSRPKAITVTNTAATPVTITGVVAGGANQADFIVSGNTCAGATLPTGATCEVQIAFRPSAVGLRTAVLVVSSTAADAPHTVTMQGRGI